MAVADVGSGSDVAFRYGNSPIVCGDAQIRVQCRHLATVVTVSGIADEFNVDRLFQHVRRFILTEKPFILDLSGVESFAARGICFLYDIDDACRTADVEWRVVLSRPVIRALHLTDDEAAFSSADSVHEALHHFSDVIDARRQLLPLLRKTA